MFSIANNNDKNAQKYTFYALNEKNRYIFFRIRSYYVLIIKDSNEKFRKIHQYKSQSSIYKIHVFFSLRDHRTGEVPSP